MCPINGEGENFMIARSNNGYGLHKKRKRSVQHTALGPHCTDENKLILHITFFLKVTWINV